MGYSTYSTNNRSYRAKISGYYTSSVDETFAQQKERKAHESMLPKNALLRECRDSDIHPFTVPIIMGLDVTGSMLNIPQDLIKDGLPTLMGNIIQRGVLDASLMFLAIGDHECDRFPLQVAQFESGDAELDMWLTRTYLEGNGGGNAGESYLLAYYYAARHVITDAWEKRHRKGFLFTIGDEPFLRTLPKSFINEMMDKSTGIQSSLTIEDLYKEVSEKYNVYHLHVNHNGRSIPKGWKDLLNQNCIEITDYTKIPQTIVDIVSNHPDAIYNNSSTNTNPKSEPGSPKSDIIL